MRAENEWTDDDNDYDTNRDSDSEVIGKWWWRELDVDYIFVCLPYVSLMLTTLSYVYATCYVHAAIQKAYFLQCAINLNPCMR